MLIDLLLMRYKLYKANFGLKSNRMKVYFSFFLALFIATSALAQNDTTQKNRPWKEK